MNISALESSLFCDKEPRSLRKFFERSFRGQFTNVLVYFANALRVCSDRKSVV